MKFSFCLMTLIAVASIVAAPAVACDQPQADKPEAATTATEAQAPVAAGGMMAFIDEETGRVTSTPTEEQRATMKALVADMLSQSDEGLYDEYLANGAVLRNLQGRFQSATVVRIDADGAQHVECTTTTVNPDEHIAERPATTEPAAGSVK